MKKVRTMVIIVDAEDENDITIMSNNLEGCATFCQNQVEFLKKVSKKWEERSKKLSRDFCNSTDTFF